MSGVEGGMGRENEDEKGRVLLGWLNFLSGFLSPSHSFPFLLPFSVGFPEPEEVR